MQRGFSSARVAADPGACVGLLRIEPFAFDAHEGQRHAIDADRGAQLYSTDSIPRASRHAQAADGRVAWKLLAGGTVGTAERAILLSDDFFAGCAIDRPQR